MKDEKYICGITKQDCYHLLEAECDFEIVTGKKCPFEKAETCAAEITDMIFEYTQKKAKEVR